MATITKLSPAEALVAVARPIILEVYRRDSCVASTWIAIEALRYFGVRAKPFECRAMLWNARYHQRFMEGLRPLDDPEAWAVGIGYEDPNWKPDDPNSDHIWSHLVAITDEHLIDLSLDQASHPEHGLGVSRPFLLGLDLDLVGPAGRAVYPFSSGGVLIYERFHSDGWQHSTNWSGNANNRGIAGQVIRAMKNAMRP